ncbi:MAG TPA: YCF48-related protein, partial [Ignavibacteria bacterium]|nr:YCF48-related protein [Ignavibacteria bacterium]
VVLKTINGGEVWDELNSGLLNNFYGIVFTDVFTGYISSNKGKILKTTNSGYNWIEIQSGANINAKLESIFFVNNDIGFVSGDQNLRTTNGGNNWSIFPGSGFDIFFTNSLTGYRTGGSGIILKSTNSGINWVVQDGNVSNNLDGIYFKNSEIGYCVGDGGAITKTTNGGVNWVPQMRITNNDLNSIVFTDANNGYIVGQFNTLLKTTNGGLVFITSNSQNIPNEFSLSQNYPNPFNASTIINYDIVDPAEISIDLYSITGKKIKTLIKDFQRAGSYKILFDASELSAGVYLYSLFRNGKIVATKKLTLIK